VIIAAVAAAIHGGLFGKRSDVWGDSPGWATAAFAALIRAVYGGPL